MQETTDDLIQPRSRREIMQLIINNETFNLLEYDCSPSFAEVGDRVETLDGTTHVERRKIKRMISVKTVDLIPCDAYRLMQVLRGTYQTVTYQDTMLNREETRIFLLNNSPQFSVRFWKNGRVLPRNTTRIF